MSHVGRVGGSGFILFRLFRILQLEYIYLKSLFVLAHLIEHNRTWLVELGVYAFCK